MRSAGASRLGRQFPFPWVSPPVLLECSRITLTEHIACSQTVSRKAWSGKESAAKRIGLTHEMTERSRNAATT